MNEFADYLRRIDLVQDLEFNTAATRMKTTPDGQYIIASGALQVLSFCSLFCLIDLVQASLNPKPFAKIRVSFLLGNGLHT